MEKIEYNLKELSYKYKNNTNKNLINYMNKTFSQPKSGIKELPKNKKNINLNELHSSKAFHRIWSSQNIYDRNWDYANKPIRNNLYSGLTKIYRAPSVQENRYEIYKLMKKERNKKMNYLNNIYNTIMINESRLYRKKLYLSGFKSNNYNTKRKVELKKKYNMNDMNDITDTNKKEKIYSSKNIKSSFNFKNSRKAISSYNNSLLRNKYSSSKKKDEENENSVSIYNNKNKKFIPTSSTNKTNYRSNLKSTKYVENSKSNDLNDTSHKSIYDSKMSTIKFKTQLKIRRKEYKNIYYELYQRENKLKNSKIFLYFNPDNERQNSIRPYNSIEVSRMSLKLNEMVFDYELDLYQNLAEFAQLIGKFKTFKEFQIIRLEEMSKHDIKGLEKRINLLQKNLKKVNKIYFVYFREMQDYMAFLKNKKLSLINDSETENNKRFNLYFEIEKLITENITKQRELERLILIKNFLIQVKFYLLKQPNYFDKILKEVSHKYDLGKLILNLKIGLQSQTIVKFMESIPEIKEENDKLQNNIMSFKTSRLLSKANTNINVITNKISPKKNYKKYSQIYGMKSKSNNNKLNNNVNKNNNEKIDKEIVKLMRQQNKTVFNSPGEFLDLIRDHENKNLRLIQEYNYIKNYINKLKREFEDMSKYNFIEEIENEINNKKALLKVLKEQNSSLIERYNYFNNIDNNLLDNNLKKKIKDVKKGAIVDLNTLKYITYNKLIESYNKKGMYLLEKLLGMIKKFFNSQYDDYDINRGYELIGKNELNRILQLNHKSLKNVSIVSINEYTIRLLNLYENICEFVKYKDDIYNSIEKNKYLIRTKKEEFQLQRKMNNAKNLRRLEDEKREANIKNIMQKDININSLFRKVMDENIVLKNKIKKNKSMIDFYKHQKELKENEFYFYVRYDNDF